MAISLSYRKGNGSSENFNKWLKDTWLMDSETRISMSLKTTHLHCLFLNLGLFLWKMNALVTLHGPSSSKNVWLSGVDSGGTGIHYIAYKLHCVHTKPWSFLVQDFQFMKAGPCLPSWPMFFLLLSKFCFHLSVLFICLFSFLKHLLVFLLCTYVSSSSKDPGTNSLSLFQALSHFYLENFLVK